MRSGVSKIIPSTSSPSDAGAVVVKNQSGEEETLEADVVIMGVGVAPATEYLKRSEGFTDLIDKSGAVHVDEYLRVKGLDGSVFAIGKSRQLCFSISSAHVSPGDIAMYPQPGTGEPRRIEHWNVSPRSYRGLLIVRLLNSA